MVPVFLPFFLAFLDVDEVSNVMFEAKLMDCVSRVLRRFVATEGKAAVVVAMGKQLDLEGRVTSPLVEVMTQQGA